MMTNKNNALLASQIIHYAMADCFLGKLLVAKSAVGVCAICLADHNEELPQALIELVPKTTLILDQQSCQQELDQLLNYISTPSIGLNLTLDMQGTLFQEQVWQVLLKIPLGEYLSYTEVANRVGKPKAVRAVANACANNRLAIAIPCHRVVRANGNLAGYRWGLKRKQELLRRESEAVGVNSMTSNLINAHAPCSAIV
ncbi:methylated-DNA--[protein]-cysteine S-methyltransferase [Methylomonas sp. AM2-LC]|uniref:methylated-DNA--[protein]-cysteine S-methyltransferase n=1 Tax=Methylomonas sp. AM2-LC TaxID=3153301 RepID=UPI003263B9DD